MDAGSLSKPGFPAPVARMSQDKPISIVVASGPTRCVWPLRLVRDWATTEVSMAFFRIHLSEAADSHVPDGPVRFFACRSNNWWVLSVMESRLSA